VQEATARGLGGLVETSGQLIAQEAQIARLARDGFSEVKTSLSGQERTRLSWGRAPE
jgi:hypothetical protein